MATSRASSETESEASPSTSGPTPEEVRARKEKIGRYVALFIMPFIIVSMMYATYVGTMHSPAPSDVPVAVVGAGEVGDEVVDALTATGGDTLDVRRVNSEADARTLLDDRDIAGAVVAPADTSHQVTVLTAQAAGPSQAATIQTVLVPVIAGQGWDVTTQDVAPLPEGDASGTAVLFGAMGMMLAGYAPLSMLMLALPDLLSLRRFLPLVLGWSALTSTVIWTILGPVVGAVDGHYPTFLGIGMLATTAVGLSQLLFTKIVGPLAVLVGMCLWVVLGMPSSNLALSITMVPDAFRWMHDVLPLPAAGEALRSAVCFDSSGLGSHLLTLTLWALGALALIIAKERLSTRTTIPGAPKITDPLGPHAALAGGPPRSRRFRLGAAVAFPLSILIMVVGFMSFSMHEPQVHDLPVAVVGSSQQADAVAGGLQDSMDGLLSVDTVASAGEARALIEERAIVAAYVLPTAPGQNATLVTSSGAGLSQKNAVEAIFREVSQGSQTPLELEDVAPLTDSDTQGSNSMYIGMSWIMAGFLMLAVLRGGAPELKRFRQFAPILGGWAVGMSVWLWLLFDVIIGAVSVDPLVLIPLGALTIFSMGAFTSLFTRTLGLAGIIPAMALLILLGVPASGGGISLYMVPELFTFFNAVLPLPAAVDIARALVYFDGVGVWDDVLVVSIWGAAGLALSPMVDRWVAHRDERRAVTDLDQSATIMGPGEEAAEALVTR